MATYTSDLYDVIFQGKGQIPDKFIVNYRGKESSSATLQVKYLDTDGKPQDLWTSAKDLDEEHYFAHVLECPLAPMLGFWFVITNVEDLAEIQSIVMVTTRGQRVEATLNL